MSSVHAFCEVIGHDPLLPASTVTCACRQELTGNGRGGGAARPGCCRRCRGGPGRRCCRRVRARRGRRRPRGRPAVSVPRGRARSQHELHRRPRERDRDDKRRQHGDRDQARCPNGASHGSPPTDPGGSGRLATVESVDGQAGDPVHGGPEKTQQDIAGRVPQVLTTQCRNGQHRGQDRQGCGQRDREPLEPELPLRGDLKPTGRGRIFCSVAAKTPQAMNGHRTTV